MDVESSRTHPVLCVDNEPLFCEGLKSRLEREPNLAWAGSTGSCRDVVAEAQRTGAKAALIEILVNGGDPFEVIRDVTRECPGTRVMVLSAHVRDCAIHDALEAGALGYFSKQDDPDTVIDGINAIVRGRHAFGPSVRERCCDDAPHLRSNGHATSHPNGNGSSNGSTNGHPSPLAKYDLLTRREREVLRMIGQGLTRRAIAESMHRSPKTVDCHRAAVMEKLGLHDRVELVRYAIREGIVHV